MYGDSLYGIANYSSNQEDNSDSQERYINLMELLPDYYQNVQQMLTLQTILGYKAGDASYETQHILDQCFISTATWGLDCWERLLGLTTDKSKSYESRREILFAKLRGSGTTTKEMLKNTALAYTNAEVDVVEYPAESRFVLKFIGVKGIPPNMSGLIKTIDTIKPAHLMYSFEYVYSWWDNVKALTWETAKNYTWNQLKQY